MCEDLADRHQDPATSQKTHTQYSHCITGHAHGRQDSTAENSSQVLWSSRHGVGIIFKCYS